MTERLTFESRGNVELLSQQKLAVFSSRKTPREIYPAATALFEKLQRQRLSLAGGWQAPLEKQLIKSAHFSQQANYIMYLAGNLNRVKLSDRQKELLSEKKLLLLSQGKNQSRVSSSQIGQRDALIFSQIKKVLFMFIVPGGRLENYFNELCRLQYQVYVLDHPRNQLFFTKDAIAVSADSLDLVI